MPARRATPGTKQLNLEVKEELLEEFRAFVEARHGTLRNHVERALRRHLDNPPPIVPDPPLPACEPDEVPAPKKRGKKT